MVSVTDAVGIAGMKGAPEGPPPVTGRSPVASAFTVTAATRIDPSSQVVFTSVCVGSDPTCSPPNANPFGTTWPNVTHPGVRPTVASVATCASIAAPRAKQSASTVAASETRRTRRKIVPRRTGRADEADHRGELSDIKPPNTPAYHRTRIEWVPGTQCKDLRYLGRRYLPGAHERTRADTGVVFDANRGCSRRTMDAPRETEGRESADFCLPGRARTVTVSVLTARSPIPSACSGRRSCECPNRHPT